MMSRKAYNPAKVSSPTTSDGSNSSADNNNNLMGSPGRGGAAGRSGMLSLAEYHQDYQQKLSPPQLLHQHSDDTGARQRGVAPSGSDSSLSRSTGHSLPASAAGSPYFTSGEGSSLPSGSAARPRDTSEQITGLVRRARSLHSR